MLDRADRRPAASELPPLARYPAHPFLLAAYAVLPGDDARYFRIRFGNLNAMYLPGVAAEVPDDLSSVNTLRFLFREAFGRDVDLLPDRSFTWPDNDHIYDFRDVTDQLRP